LVLFFKKEQKKALLFEKRSKNFLVVGCVPWQRGEAFIYSCIVPKTDVPKAQSSRSHRSKCRMGAPGVTHRDRPTGNAALSHSTACCLPITPVMPQMP
jgi:hypothetical protein